MTAFHSIPSTLAALKAGRMIIVVDDEDRENEGDLVMAAGHMTEEAMAFIIRYTGGVVCLSLSNAIADQLELPPMVQVNTAARGTPFTVSIDAAKGITTGISARDRAQTVQMAARPTAKPRDFNRPGHIFPLRAADGGVLCRAGHTEAASDLCRLAGVRPAAVLSELMNDDGTMMRLAALRNFAKQHRIPIITIADLIAYRRKNESFIRRRAETDLETATGLWHMIVYDDTCHHDEHVALIKGNISSSKPVTVRVHSECLTGDVLGSVHCDCGQQLRIAMEQIEREGAGVLLYMRQEGRGIGLTNKIRAYDLQRRKGLDTAEANTALGFPVDLRDYGIGAQILKDLGAKRIRILTNNPKKVVGLSGYGIEIVEQLPLEMPQPGKLQKKYLLAKKNKMGHVIRSIG
ncbi:MAG: bifunctional 3,4-dihydroxy-2-butanone-4-phosphate synthase/GTP cyclohydrolase II [Candidatus Peregrinibacteria bacterium]